MLSVSELHVGLVYFICLVHDNCCCPFVCFFEVYSRAVFQLLSSFDLVSRQVVFGFSYFDLGKLCLDIFQVALSGFSLVSPILEKRCMLFYCPVFCLVRFSICILLICFLA